MARMLVRAACGAALWTLSVVAAVCGQESADPLRIARLVRELGDDSFAVRTQADAELAKLGPGARGAIEAAVRSDDPEVRLRAKDLLRAIKIHDLWAPGHFDGPDEPASAAQILQLLGEQTGNHLLVGDKFGAFRDQPVQLAGSGDYWKVLDELCRQSGNHCRPHYDSRTPGVVIVAGPPGEQPLAYAGPVRARISSARRSFVEELSYEDTRGETNHAFQFNVDLAWEDRFRLVAYRAQPEWVEATTISGRRLKAAQSSAGGWNVTSRGARQVSMTLRLEPPPVDSRQLDTLTLGWGLLAVGDMATLVVDDLTSRTPKFQDDVELIIENCAVADDGRFELTVRVVRNLAQPEPPEILLEELEMKLLDAAGQPLRKLNDNPTLSEHGATLKAAYLAEGGTGPAVRLQLTYPRLRSHRNLEIVFRNVPLPTARPE